MYLTDTDESSKSTAHRAKAKWSVAPPIVDLTWPKGNPARLRPTLLTILAKMKRQPRDTQVEIENKYFASHLWRIDRALPGDKSTNSAGHVNSTLSIEMIKQHLIKLNCAQVARPTAFPISSFLFLYPRVGCNCSSKRFVSRSNVGFYTDQKL